MINCAEAVEQVARGRMLIIVDNEERENEGDFYIAGVKATPDAINIMATSGRGLICCPIASSIASRLHLHAQAPRNNALHGTNFTVSIDAIEGTTTGISTYDRAATILRLSDQSSRPSDFARPGHIFPIVSADGGLNERHGHTEAAVSLAEMANLPPVGVICEILDDDGTMANRSKLRRLASDMGIDIISVSSIIDALCYNDI